MFVSHRTHLLCSFLSTLSSFSCLSSTLHLLSVFGRRCPFFSPSSTLLPKWFSILSIIDWFDTVSMDNIVLGPLVLTPSFPHDRYSSIGSWWVRKRRTNSKMHSIFSRDCQRRLFIFIIYFINIIWYIFQLRRHKYSKTKVAKISFSFSRIFEKILHHCLRFNRLFDDYPLEMLYSIVSSILFNRFLSQLDLPSPSRRLPSSSTPHSTPMTSSSSSVLPLDCSTPSMPPPPPPISPRRPETIGIATPGAVPVVSHSYFNHMKLRFMFKSIDKYIEKHK